MKIRTGFVSNSSSSSFVIAKAHLTKEQEQKIKELFHKIEDDLFFEEFNIDEIMDEIYKFGVSSEFIFSEYD